MDEIAEPRDQLEEHQRVQDAFARVLAQVPPGSLDAPTPCTEWTVRDLVAHVVAGNWRSAGLTPEPIDPEASASQISAAHAASARAALGAFGAPGGMTRSVTLPFGTLSGAQYLDLRTTDVLVHAWDLAAATHQARDLEPEIASARLEHARRMLSPDLRGEGGPFRPEVPCRNEAQPTDRLAAFLGRELPEP